MGATVAVLVALSLVGVGTVGAAAPLDADAGDALTTTDDHNSFDVCVQYHHQDYCYATVWVPDVPPVCYPSGPHGEKECLTN